MPSVCNTLFVHNLKGMSQRQKQLLDRFQSIQQNVSNNKNGVAEQISVIYYTWQETYEPARNTTNPENVTVNDFVCHDRVRTFAGRSPREQYINWKRLVLVIIWSKNYRMYVGVSAYITSRHIQMYHYNIETALLLFTTPTMAMHYGARRYPNSGWPQGLNLIHITLCVQQEEQPFLIGGTTELGRGTDPVEVFASWLRQVHKKHIRYIHFVSVTFDASQDFGPNIHIIVATDDIHYLRITHVLLQVQFPSKISERIVIAVLFHCPTFVGCRTPFTGT